MMAAPHAFLDGMDRRQVRLPSDLPATTVELAIGQGSSGLEVIVAHCSSRPSTAQLKNAWRTRKNNRAAPLVLVALDGARAHVCGISGDDPQIWLDMAPFAVETICREALAQADRHAATRCLRDAFPAAESPVPGIRNEGFLATHALRSALRQGGKLEQARHRALGVMACRGVELLRGLGYTIEEHDRVTSILRAHDRRTALAVLLNPDESPESLADRFSRMSPISYALAVADRENLQYVILLHGNKIRIYPSQVGVGVGRRGRTETWLECHLGLIGPEESAALWLVFSSDALAPSGTLETLIDSSGRFAGDLATNLRDRIYRSVVPRVAEGIVVARKLRHSSAGDLAETYSMAMVLLFRILFIAYAEDKDLLPYRWNELYRRRSLKTKALELLQLANKGVVFDESDSLWEELRQLFHAVNSGRREWGVPPYDGGLFSEDPDESEIGSKFVGLTLPNSIIGPAMTDLLLVETTEGVGPTDFRSLSVTEFGTIYEGLLESELSVAEIDLSVGDDEIWRPNRRNEKPAVRAGEVYLHNASGARKSSGTYFTKSFAVEHLLDRALEPALLDHLNRLDGLSTREAAERLLTFTVADIAMGSGHFLVAAVDRVERAFTGYLARRPLPEVNATMERLRQHARDALGALADQVEIEDAQLLRRLIARRCIYGVDINPVAVQLARLAIWIHTFVPGLPLSILDHNLACGDSLVGIARIGEAREEIERSGLPLFPIDARHLLGQAENSLTSFVGALDDSPAVISGARAALHKAAEFTRPAAALFDIVAAARVAKEDIPENIARMTELKADIANSSTHRKARRSLGDLMVFHFPVAFPEVFLTDEPGFHVIIGNPPWQEATLEEDAFWARHSPGLRALPQREQEVAKTKLRKSREDLKALYERELGNAEVMRLALTTGPFPGMGTGDPDLYKAFCWRFWHLVRNDKGRVGVVLPRSALNAKGSSAFRQQLLNSASEVDITVLLNTGSWVFEMEPRYTIGLVAFCKSSAETAAVSLRGPYASYERYLAGVSKPAAIFAGSAIATWNDTASLPLLPTEESIGVFAQLRKSPRMDLVKETFWQVRPHTELHATNDKKYMDLKSASCPAGFWPVYKGESFDIWQPDTGKYYAWANPKKLLPLLQKKRLSGLRKANSVYNAFNPDDLKDKASLPCLRPRIAFRDITRATDTRTVRPALIPPEVFITNKGPYLLWISGDERDQAFLLGVLSSIPMDWYARRFVEIGLNFYVFNPLPVPRPKDHDALRKRVIQIAGRLACPDKRFAAWAKKIGVSCGPLDDDEKADLIHELDAVVAWLYGLEERQVVHIFETFHEGWDYQERLAATLKHYRTWEKKQ